MTTGECVEEEDGVLFVGGQCAVCLVGKLDIRQGFAAVEGEIANGENMGADRVVHFVLTEVQIALDVRKKGPGLINTPVSFFSACGALPRWVT